MHPRKPTFVFLLSLCLCLGATPVAATSIVQMNQAQLVEKASLIVRGKVLHTHSVWNKSRLAIVTLVTLQVQQELLQRKTTPTVTIRHYGGTVGNVTMGLPSGPKFHAGQEVILFLSSSPHLPQEYLLTGWTQGVWLLSKGEPSDPQAPASSEFYVQRQPVPYLYHKTPSQARGSFTTSAPQRLRLTDFTQRIRRLHKQHKAKLLQRNIKAHAPPKARLPQKTIQRKSTP